MDIFYYFYNELHLCVLLIATPYTTELQLVITLCVNDCNYVATGIQTELQSAVQWSCNWPTQPDCN